MMAAIRLVFGQRSYAAAAALLFPIVFIFYVWAGQVLIIGRQGLSILLEPDVIMAAAVLAALFVLSLPLQIYAVRLALVGARQPGSTVLGLVVGSVSMSCCTPVILPAVLSLIGLSGTTILSINLAVHRYFVPLALLGALLLTYSVISTGASLAQTCVLEPAGADEQGEWGSGFSP